MVCAGCSSGKLDRRRVVVLRGRGLCGGLDEPSRDPELPDREVLVGRHEDARRRQERVSLPARMLGEVLLQLGDQRVLVASELLPVLR